MKLGLRIYFCETSHFKPAFSWIDKSKTEKDESKIHRRRYNETIRCMDQGAGYCPNQEPFNVFTSGLYYMCIEQRKGGKFIQLRLRKFCLSILATVFCFKITYILGKVKPFALSLSITQLGIFSFRGGNRLHWRAGTGGSNRYAFLHILTAKRASFNLEDKISYEITVTIPKRQCFQVKLSINFWKWRCFAQDAGFS